MHPAPAESKYPEHPIRLIVPFGPGGTNDTIGRLWADRVKLTLGPVLVENQGGAGGLVAGATVARAHPDGHTLLLGGGASQILVAAAANRTAYDPARDFAPVSILVVTALSIAIHPSVPAQNLKELVQYAKANPGKLSYASSGAGSVTHLTGELFKSLTGTADIVHVPYKGGGQSITDLISGHVPMIIVSINGQLLDLHQASKARILAVTTPQRVSAAPDIPTAVEAGVPGMISQNFIGLFAPAGTPKAVIEQIASATRIAMADDEFRANLIASGFEPYPDSSPEEAQRFIESEANRLAPVIKALGFEGGVSR
jgi:tripartite-type tricarboxylate transporter receptor subunit TctC